MEASKLKVQKLKELLKSRNLPTYGTKTELIRRLDEAAPDGAWMEGLDGVDVDDLHDVDEDVTNDEAERNFDIMQRELDLVRRERDLLQRELDFTRGENRNGRPRGTQSNVNVKTISELLSVFSGSDGTFRKWRKQIDLLRNTYELNDDQCRILIGSKLADKAHTWFHSKSEHLEIEVSELLERMRRIFDIRLNRLALRRDFEKRIWRSSESFAQYYHDKVILANEVPINDNEELLEYVIDGVPDVQLRNQARIQGFQSMTGLLNAFENVTLQSEIKSKTYPEQKVRAEMKKPWQRSNERKVPLQQSIRCFNCNRPGHTSAECTRPRHERGACFRCGDTTHRIAECPQKAEKPKIETTTNAIEGAPSMEAPYLTPVCYTIADECGNMCEFNIKAMIDSGSPVSLILERYVPVDSLSTYSCENNFRGVNDSKLTILGIFEKVAKIADIDVNVKFYVVPNETMKYAALLGRDFIKNPSLKVTLGENLQIATCVVTGPQSNSDLNCIDPIMQIEYVDTPYKVSEVINVDAKIDHKTAERVREMYEKDYVTGNDSDIPEKDFEMTINLKHEQPITFRPRRLSYGEKERLRIILDDLMKQGIIRPSESPYASPIVLVRKKNGEIRLCIDYRELNKITIKDNYPTPLIDDHLDRLKNKRYYSSLDMKNGFHHVKIADNSIKYTSFVTPLGQYEYLYMPFGLTNAPRVFQRFMNTIFNSLIKDDKILMYIDDILIATNDIDEHLEILSEVFKIARKHKVKFRFDKCIVLQSEVTYLGYQISEQGIRPSASNIESVLNYPVPRNVTEVHRFVCLASYFRRFIQDFARVAKPLYDLIKKNSDFQFGSSENDAFEHLKNALSSQPVLAIYSPTLDTELHCDASSSGFGAIFLQKQIDGAWRPIFYFSQRTTATESRYHSYELEFLAVVYAVQRFHTYLYGIKFKIITDCDSFRLTLNKQSINHRISRWAMFLQQYDYEIQHRPNKRMTHVDALSRCHCIFIIEPNTLERTLSIRQDSDAEITKIREQLEVSENKCYELRDGLVYRKTKDKKLLFYVPLSMENNIIRTCHDDIGHVGLDKVVENISRVYWFPNMREKVKTYIKNCLRCIEFSPQSGKNEGLLHSIPKGDKPFITIHIDHCGPLEKTGKGYKYIFAIIDAFTKFVRLYACKSVKSEEAIKHLREYFRSYSKPQRLISDRGTAFTSHMFANFMKEELIDHVLIATGTPRANGQIERINRVIIPMIAKLCESPNKWDKVLCSAEFSINNTVCRSTGSTPSQLLFGVNQFGESNDKLRAALTSITDEKELTEIRKCAAENIIRSQKSNETYYNARHKKATVYNVNDYVMIRNTDVTPGINKKLLPRFKGPYKVTKVLDNDRYIVEDIDGFQLTQIPFRGVVGPDQMRYWIRT